jgi:hypothetical protein
VATMAGLLSPGPHCTNCSTASTEGPFGPLGPHVPPEHDPLGATARPTSCPTEAQPLRVIRVLGYLLPKLRTVLENRWYQPAF